MATGWSPSHAPWGYAEMAPYVTEMKVSRIEVTESLKASVLLQWVLAVWCTSAFISSKPISLRDQRVNTDGTPDYIFILLDMETFNNLFKTPKFRNVLSLSRLGFCSCQLIIFKMKFFWACSRILMWKWAACMPNRLKSELLFCSLFLAQMSTQTKQNTCMGFPY